MSAVAENPMRSPLHPDIRAAIAAHEAAFEESVKAAKKKRLKALAKTKDNIKAQQLVISKCRDDVAYFISNWCYTYDPRKAGTGTGAHLPFVLRPRQVEYVRWLEHFYDIREPEVLVPKSRDEGASYVTLAFMLHKWLFVEGFAGSVGSLKKDSVDVTGNPKSLFFMFRYMLDKLPKWMKPKGYDKRKHRAVMRENNPEMKSSLTGELGDSIGRSGRSRMALLDEFEHLERQEEVNRAIRESSAFRVKVSTVKGQGTLMHIEETSGAYRVFRLKWDVNPDKNYTIDIEVDGKIKTVHPWYESKKQQYKTDPIGLAQEVDINRDSAAEGVLIPSTWAQAAFDIDLERGSDKFAGLDVAAEGGDIMPYTAREGSVVTRMQVMMSKKLSDNVKELAELDDIEEIFYDAKGVGAYSLSKLEEMPTFDELKAQFTNDKGNINLPAFEQMLMQTEVRDFIVSPVRNDQKCSRTKYPDRPKVEAVDRFVNFAAELAWRLRLRFYNTYLRHVEGHDIPDSECISLKALKNTDIGRELQQQLSQPLFEKFGTKDLLKVNKKGHGTKSPDLYESLMYSFAPPPERVNIELLRMVVTGG